MLNITEKYNTNFTCQGAHASTRFCHNFAGLLLVTGFAFYRASSYASAVLAVVILSVHPSVCPLHTCFVTKPDNALRIF